MSWQLTDNLERFASAAEPFLRSDPVRHTVFLTVIGGLRSADPSAYAEGEPLFGWWTTSAGDVGGALLRIAPYPVLFSAMPPEAVTAAVEVLAGHRLTGANLLDRDLAAFTAGWRARTGATHLIRLRTRLFRLDRLVPPDPAPSGSARPATEADRPLLVDWFRAFHEVINEGSQDIDAVVDDHLGSGGVTLWQDGGVPVAMAARSRAESGMVRVRAVWTPPEHRRRGYAAGVTAASTRAALDAGATDVVLFTDVGNPTSNALYQRLGYRPIEDRTAVDLSS